MNLRILICYLDSYWWMTDHVLRLRVFQPAFAMIWFGQRRTTSSTLSVSSWPENQWLNSAYQWLDLGFAFYGRTQWMSRCWAWRYTFALPLKLHCCLSNIDAHGSAWFAGLLCGDARASSGHSYLFWSGSCIYFFLLDSMVLDQGAQASNGFWKGSPC